MEQAENDRRHQITTISTEPVRVGTGFDITPNDSPSSRIAPSTLSTQSTFRPNPNPPPATVAGSLPLSYYFSRDSPTAPVDVPGGNDNSDTASGSPRLPRLRAPLDILPTSSPLDQLRASVRLARAEADRLPIRTDRENLERFALARRERERIALGLPPRTESTTVTESTSQAATPASEGSSSTSPATGREDMERVLRGAREVLRSAVGFAERLEQVSVSLSSLSSSTAALSSSTDSPPSQRRRLMPSAIPTSDAGADDDDRAALTSYLHQPSSPQSQLRPFPSQAALSLERSINTLRTAAARIDRLLEEFAATSDLIRRSSARSGAYDSDVATEQSFEERRSAHYARMSRPRTRHSREDQDAEVGEASASHPLANLLRTTTTAPVRPIARTSPTPALSVVEPVHDPNATDFDSAPASAASSLPSGSFTSSFGAIRQTLIHNYHVKLDWNGVEIPPAPCPPLLSAQLSSGGARPFQPAAMHFRVGQSQAALDDSTRTLSTPLMGASGLCHDESMEERCGR